MLRVQIGEVESIPQDVYDKIAEQFTADAENKVFPVLKATCIETGKVFPIGFIGNIGRLDNGETLADLMINLSLEVNYHTGQIHEICLTPKGEVVQTEEDE